MPDRVMRFGKRSRNKRLKIETDLGTVYLIASLTSVDSQSVEHIRITADEGAYIALCYEDPETGNVVNITLDSLSVRFIDETN